MLRGNTSTPSRARIGVSGLAGCCLVANLALISGQALAGPCTLKRLATVDLTIRDGIPTVPVIINGHPAAMEVNTSNAVGEISSLHGPDDAVYRSNCEGGEAPLTFGMDIARRLRFYFATKECVLYVSEADATK